MQRRKGRQRDKLFVPPSLTVLKYGDSKGLRGELVYRYLSQFINLKKYLSRNYPVPVK